MARKGNVWSRDELVLALELYREPGCSLDDTDFEVQELAASIGRTPSAVAYKLQNFKSLDPSRRGGLDHRGSRDEEVWNEFAGRIDALHAQSEAAAMRIATGNARAEEAVFEALQRTVLQGNYRVPDSLAERKVRLRMETFRRIVLNDYGYRCSLCDIDIPELLDASHIVPWSDDIENRLNPHNGIALCLLHHGAFDGRFVAIDEDGKVMMSPVLEGKSPEVRRVLAGSGTLRPPSRNLPGPEFLAQHRNLAFERWRALAVPASPKWFGAPGESRGN